MGFSFLYSHLFILSSITYLNNVLSPFLFFFIFLRLVWSIFQYLFIHSQVVHTFTHCYLLQCNDIETMRCDEWMSSGNNNKSTEKFTILLGGVFSISFGLVFIFSDSFCYILLFSVEFWVKYINAIFFDSLMFCTSRFV